MRADTLLHFYDEATGEMRTLQIPYAIPEACPVDPDILRVRALDDGTTVFATSQWVWAETHFSPPSDPAWSASEDGGPVAVRYRVPATGEERGVWCQDAIVSADPHSRPCVLDAGSRHPLGLFRAPIEMLDATSYSVAAPS